MTPRLGHTVIDIDHRSVTLHRPSATERIPARTVIWAGRQVVASSLAGVLAERAGLSWTARASSKSSRTSRSPVIPR